MATARSKATTNPTRARRRRSAQLRSGRPRSEFRDRENQRPGAHAADGPGLAGLPGLQPCLGVRVPGRRGLPAFCRRGHLGHPNPQRLELRHHRLRVVDRDRPCGHADLGLSPADAPEMADLDQPHRRGHDHLRRDVRGTVSPPAPRPAVVLLLAGAVSQHHGPLAPVPQRPDLGRICREHLLHRLAVVLVHGHDPRPGHAPRPGHGPPGPDRLRPAGPGLAELGPALAPLRDGLPLARRAGDPAGHLGALGGEFGFRQFARAGLA